MIDLSVRSYTGLVLSYRLVQAHLTDQTPRPTTDRGTPKWRLIPYSLYVVHFSP